MSMDSTTISERKELIASYCNQATRDLNKTYETSVNRTDRYIRYISKGIIGTASKAALGIFG